MKKIVLLGASGSIGTQSIDVVLHHRNEFSIIGLSVGYNIAKLRELLHCLPEVKRVCVAEEAALAMLEKEYPDIQFLCGEQGLAELCAWEEYDLLLNAVVGFRGLQPTLIAITHDKDVALANKESLVAGGPLVKQAMKEHSVHLYPIDSEHSAIFQCLRGNRDDEVEKLIITASGGSFRDYDRNALANVSAQEALRHPNWQMGERITIDSATMMNKGFEVIEAHYLFDIPLERIETIIHRESIIHSMVQYKDGAIIAQLGSADMRLPIQYALTYPERKEIHHGKALDLHAISALSFQRMEFDRFPLLRLAYEVGKRGGNGGAIMNGADEASVAYFLKGRISFLDIERAIFAAVKELPLIKHPTLQELIESDHAARRFVDEFVERI